MAAGLLMLWRRAVAMSDWTPDVPQGQMMVTLLLQGFGLGFVFNPMTVISFTTLPASLRGYATSLQALCRNIGQAVGVSVTSLMLVRGTQIVACRHRRDHHPVRSRAYRPATRRRAWLDPATPHGAATARSDGQPAGADHRLQQRLPPDGAGERAVAAAAVADAAL